MALRLRTLAAVIGAVCCAAPAPRTLDACAPAPAPGDVVSVAQESAVIVWNAKTRMEHFIRRASFDTTAKDFGFLVPTPTRPALAAASDAVFTRLEMLMAPEVIHERRLSGVSFTPLVTSYFMSGSVGAGAPLEGRVTGSAVRVLESTQVAGYDAVVLQADAATGLTRWLETHGYATSEDLTAWLTPYVTAKWIVTAFKVAADAAPQPGGPHRGPATSPVRMSFTTDRPVFPYREPESQRRPGAPPAPRSLEVRLLSDTRMDGRLDDSAMTWPGTVTFADALSPDARAEVAGVIGLDLDQLPARTWLTAFSDQSSPRPGVADLYFSPSGSADVVRPPPIIDVETWELPVPADLVLLLVGLVVGGVAWRRRRR